MPYLTVQEIETIAEPHRAGHITGTVLSRIEK